MGNRNTVLYLRQTEGGGGGADSVIINTLRHVDRSRFRVIAAYPRKRRVDLSRHREGVERTGVAYMEFAGRRFFDRRQFSLLARLVRTENVDIVHSHDSKSNFLAWLLRRSQPDLKLVSTMHGWTGKSLRGRLYRWLDCRLLGTFDRVIAVSEDLRNKAMFFAADRVTIVRNGIDTEYWQPCGQPDTAGGFTIGFVGRLSREKAPLDFVRIADLLRNGKDFRFLVAGEGPEREDAEALAGRLGLGGTCVFLGHVGHDVLPEVYAGMHVLLLTSRTEGLPVAVLEAMASGRPVVAADVGGVSEIIVHGENGLLFPSGDLKAAAAAVLRLRKDPDLAAGLIQDARRTVQEHFSIQGQVRRLEAVYESL